MDIKQLTPATGRQAHHAACLALLIAIALPGIAFADGNDFMETGKKVCGFFANINNILNMTSIAVVTAAVVFSGYQIAFAHKRISDVSPILIGGVMIGAAGQVANMVIGDTGQSCTASIDNVLLYLASRHV